MDPVILEVAINGPTQRADRHRPLGTARMVEDSLACFEAGAAIIHNHVDQGLGPAETTRAYLDVYRPVLSKRPDAILCCGLAGSVDEPSVEEVYAHVEPLTQAGMRMAIADPGSLNFSVHDAADGTPTGSIVYRNSYDDTRYFMALLGRLGLGPSLSIFEPGFLRATLAYHRAGALPAGAFVKLYFGGDYNPFTGLAGGAGFGLPPTTTALEAYLEMMAGCRLPWAVAVIGGDVVASGLADLAVARGGHLRVGLEDYGGPGAPSNVELIGQAAEVAARHGRRLSTPAEAAAILGLKAPQVDTRQGTS